MPRWSRRCVLAAAFALAVSGCGARTDIALFGVGDASAADVAVTAYDGDINETSTVDVRGEPDAGDANDAREEETGPVQYVYPCKQYGGQCEYPAPDGGCVTGVAILQAYYLPCNVYGQVCCKM